ncbi:acyl-coenzyme A thioesterase 1-like [Glandiceps talaboti]
MWRQYRSLSTVAVVTARTLYPISQTSNFVRNLSKITASITVNPRITLADQRVSVCVSDLPPLTPVTIRSLVKNEKKQQFEAHGHYTASIDGQVDVTTQPCIGGSYQGIEPMGLFWSKLQSPGQRSGLRFTKADVTKPSIMEFSVYPGHLDTPEFEDISPISTTVIERHYMDKHIERIAVREGRVRGTVFKPKGTGPFPGIVDLYGTAGGLMEMRAAMLANHGYAVIALAFCGYDDLPKTYRDFDFDYFEESLNWFQRQDYIKPGGVGTIGISMGAELALAMAVYFPDQVKAVASLNGSHMHTYIARMFRGQLLPFTDYSVERFVSRDHNSYAFMELLDEPNEKAIFDFKNVKAQLLLMVGEDDLNWKSSFYAQETVKRLKSYNKTNYKLLSYPDVGHLIEPACTPFCKSSYHNLGMTLAWGGKAKPHATAQQECWKEILQWFHQHLQSENSKL